MIELNYAIEGWGWYTIAHADDEAHPHLKLDHNLDSREFYIIFTISPPKKARPEIPPPVRLMIVPWLLDGVW